MGGIARTPLAALGGLCALAFAGAVAAQAPPSRAPGTALPRCWTRDPSTGLLRPEVLLPRGCPEGHAARASAPGPRVRRDRAVALPTTASRPAPLVAGSRCLRFDPAMGLIVLRRPLEDECFAREARAPSGPQRPPAVSPPAEPPRCTWFDPVAIAVRVIEPPPPGCAHPARRPRTESGRAPARVRLDRATGLLLPVF
jgi:hypothetical protein